MQGTKEPRNLSSKGNGARCKTRETAMTQGSGWWQVGREKRRRKRLVAGWERKKKKKEAGMRNPTRRKPRLEMSRTPS